MKSVAILAVLLFAPSVNFLNIGLPAETRPMDTSTPLPPASEVQISIPPPQGAITDIARPYPQYLAKKNQLRMVLIKVKSSREIVKLRRMKLDIIRVRPDPKQPPGKDSPSGGYIVEAVSAPSTLSKLEAEGFEVFEVGQKN